jgi:predicted nucleotidyltransferase
VESIGVIAEYNPFHNGHLYHLKKIKEMYPNDIIIVVLGGHFMQRGEVSIINKWDKTDIALTYGADIVVELPFPFATQSADIFAKGSIEILKEMGVKKLIFGSESNDIEKLTRLALIQLNNNEYQSLIKKYFFKSFIMLLLTVHKTI